MAQCLTALQADLLRIRIQRVGLEAVAEQLKLNTTTLLRAACGLQLHSATCTVIQQALGENDGEQA